MQNENNHSKQIVLGLVIGTMVGAAALYYINVSRHQKTPILRKVGRVISEVGDMLENSEIENFSDIAHEVRDSFPKGKDMLGSLWKWFSTGMDLWKKIKNGD